MAGAALLVLAVAAAAAGRVAGAGDWWTAGSQQDQEDRLRAWQERQDEIQRQQDELALQRQQILEERQKLRDDLLLERQYEQSDQQLHRERQLDDRQSESDQRLDERQHLHDDILLQLQFQQADRQRHQQDVVDDRQHMLDQRLDERQQLSDELRADHERDSDDQQRQRDELSDQRRQDRERNDREREQEQQRREREREQEQQRKEREREREVQRSGRNRWRRETGAAEEATAPAAKSYAGSQLWRVLLADKSDDKLQQLQEDAVAQVWHSNSSTWDLLVSPENQERLRKLLDEQGYQHEVVIPDLQQVIAVENPALSEEELELTGRKGHRMTWQHYHRASDMFGWLDYLAQTFPDVCDVQTIGSSYEGRPLKVLHIKGRAGSPSMWIDGGIHAREWITSSSVSYMVNELIENRDAHKSWLDKVNLYILPLANPDGYEYTHVADRMWRKNRRRGAGGGCDGTDLNRNFGYKWGGKGSGPTPCQEIYRGSNAFSEPETAAIQSFVLGRKASLKSYLSFHSYGQYVLYPWGYDRFVPPDHGDLHRVGNKIASAMRAVSGLPYSVGSSAALLYPASGGSDDWAKGVAQLKYAFTVELRDTGRHGFVLPASHIVSSGKEVLAAVRALAMEVASSSSA